MKSFKQGYLDSLCGIDSIVNAYKIVNKSSFDECQALFNDIIMYLSRKRVLKNFIIGGVKHTDMVNIMRDVVGERIPVQITTRRGLDTLDLWWDYSKSF